MMNKQIVKRKRVRKIPDRITNQIKEVSSYVGNCDDWVTIKKEIMKGIPSDLRKLFSRRDPITKEQVPNNFDMIVKEAYERFSGVDLKIRTRSERKKINL